MKQLFKPLSILLLVIISALWTSASAVEIDGIYYYLEGDEATVTNKSQRSYAYGDSNYINAYSGNITIPSTITYEGSTYTVTAIQDYAFYLCSELISINIPSSVNSIGRLAFSCSPSLKAIIVNSDNPSFSSVGGILFNKDKTILYHCPGGKTGNYVIPSTVKTIADYAFDHCEKINSVSIPDDVTSIGGYAFIECKALTNINIPASLTSLGECAFYGNECLSSPITIPSGVKKIPSSCFYNCSRLTSVNIPEGVEEIENMAFAFSNLIEEIKLPSTIKKIGNGCFQYCYSLQKINIPEGITEIPDYAFYSCSLNSIELPKTIQKIGGKAFYDCYFSTIIIPNTIKSIGSYALYSNSLEEVYVYNTPSLLAIGEHLFSHDLLEIHVYEPLTEMFKTAQYWREYADYIVGDIPINPVKSITLDKTNIVMDAYSEGTLTATINPNDASIKDVIYTSSNEDAVIILDNTGKFMTLEAGTATITATALGGSGVKATCEITVSDGTIKAESVTLNTTNTTIALGSTKTLTATVLPEDATMRTVTWKSSNTEVATVDKNGVVTAVGAGTATITATAADGKGAYAECKVNVIYNTVTLTDASSSYSNATEATANTIKYTRTFNSTNWQALYVPFSMKYSDWSNDFEVAAINNVHQYDDDDNGIFDRTELEIVKVKSGSLKANTPYLIKPKTTGTKTITINNATLKKTEVNYIYCASVNTMYTFTGTYSTISGATMISNGYYGMGGGELVQAEDNDASLGAFRWYLKIENKEEGSYAPGKITVLCLDDEMATGIDENVIDVENKVVGIYDANGRKLNEMRNGLNIVKYSDGSTKKIMK